MTHYATRALLQRVLDTVEMSFEQSVVLGLVAASDAPIDRDDVVVADDRRASRWASAPCSKRSPNSKPTDSCRLVQSSP